MPELDEIWLDDFQESMFMSGRNNERKITKDCWTDEENLARQILRVRKGEIN